MVERTLPRMRPPEGGPPLGRPRLATPPGPANWPRECWGAIILPFIGYLIARRAYQGPSRRCLARGPDRCVANRCREGQPASLRFFAASRVSLSPLTGFRF